MCIEILVCFWVEGWFCPHITDLVICNLKYFSFLSSDLHEVLNKSNLGFKLSLWAHCLCETESPERCSAHSVGLDYGWWPSLPAFQQLLIEDRLAQHFSRPCHLYFVCHFLLKVKSISGKHFMSEVFPSLQMKDLKNVLVPFFEYHTEVKMHTWKRGANLRFNQRAAYMSDPG